MAYTHPAAVQIRRVVNPRKNACWGGALASACRVANTNAQTFVKCDRFDSLIESVDGWIILGLLRWWRIRWHHF